MSIANPGFASKGADKVEELGAALRPQWAKGKALMGTKWWNLRKLPGFENTHFWANQAILDSIIISMNKKRLIYCSSTNFCLKIWSEIGEGALGPIQNPPLHVQPNKDDFQIFKAISITLPDISLRHQLIFNSMLEYTACQLSRQGWILRYK